MNNIPIAQTNILIAKRDVKHAIYLNKYVFIAKKVI